MIEEPLFSLSGAQDFDLERTGGLNVAVDEAFATAKRIQLDDTSWVDHVQGWLAGDGELMEAGSSSARKAAVRAPRSCPTAGDLVVMGGRCQKDYQHSVPKQKQPAAARLSLNFSTDTSAIDAGHPGVLHLDNGVGRL